MSSYEGQNSDEDLRQAIETYKAADGKLSQAFVAEKFGVSVSRLRRALRTNVADGAPPHGVELAAPPPTESDRKEKRERIRTGLTVLSLVLALTTGTYSVWNGHRTTIVEQQNRILTAQVQSATDPAHTLVADHRDRLYIRNASPRPLRNAVAIKVDDGEDSDAPLFQVELGDIRGCVDAGFAVAADMARQWGKTDPNATPYWVLSWTDVAEQRWELDAFASDNAGDFPGVQFEEPYTPPASAKTAMLHLTNVPKRSGLTPVSAETLSDRGLCK